MFWTKTTSQIMVKMRFSSSRHSPPRGVHVCRLRFSEFSHHSWTFRNFEDHYLSFSSYQGIRLCSGECKWKIERTPCDLTRGGVEIKKHWKNSKFHGFCGIYQREITVFTVVFFSLKRWFLFLNIRFLVVEWYFFWISGGSYFWRYFGNCLYRSILPKLQKF